MVALDRRLLIIGNAVLFSAFGCDDTPDDGVEAGVGADVGTARDARVDEPDTGEVDLGGTDRGAADGGLVDRGLDDLGAVDLGSGDLGADDLGADDLGALDLGPDDLGADLAVSLDEGVADLAPPEPDLAPPDPDMADTPDLLPPDAGGAMTCPDLIGLGCEVRDEGCCVDGSPEAVCWTNETGALSWQPIPPDFFCNCIPGPDGRETVICAVPGFVGVTRAGRRHRVAPSLRALAAWA